MTKKKQEILSSEELAKRYKALDEIDHVLLKSGMWIGDKNVNTGTFFIYENDRIVEKELEYIPGLLKIIDEIISNSVDEYRRNTNLGLTEITVQMIGNDTIVVSDNGGIPVAIHPETGTYLPQFLFGNLRTSSNYNEEEERTGVGTNGVGSALTNILSSYFQCITADGHNKCKIVWHNNMREMEEPIIEKCSEHFTTMTFKPDLKQFNIERIPFDFSHILRKRCLDAAAGTPGLKVTFELYVGEDTSEPLTSDTFQFEDYKQYIKLYDGLIDYEQLIYDKIENKWEFAIVPGSNLRVGFVNGASCNAGTHIRLLEWWVENIVSDTLKNKYKLEISNKVINNNYSIFVKLNVINPAYDSQTKEKLVTSDYKFDKSNTYHRVTEEFTTTVKESNLVLDLVEWYKQKSEVEKQRETRKMNRELSKKKYIRKLLDANSKDRSETELWIFEGDAAESGFRVARTPATQGSYKLRGVVKNTIGKDSKAIFSNQEFSDLIAAIGLKFGDNNTDKLRFKKIILCTDMDHDGNKIAGLLIGFFYDHFPEVIKAGMLYRALAPVIIASKGSDSKLFFTLDEYHKVENELEGYRIKYIKGHGGLTGKEYKQMVQQKHLFKFQIDETTDELIKAWFTGGSSKRKNLIQTNSNIISE